MQPDQPIQPDKVMENPITEGDDGKDKTPEVVKSPEVLVHSASPVDPSQVNIQSQPTPLPTPLVDDTNTEAEETKTVLDDTTIMSGDGEYVSAIKKIIHDDADKPFLEDEASDKLEKKYLKMRFNVNISDEEK